MITRSISSSDTVTGCSNSFVVTGCDIQNSIFDQSCKMEVSARSIKKFKNDASAQSEVVKNVQSEMANKISSFGTWGTSNTQVNKSILDTCTNLSTEIVNEFKRSCDIQARLNNEIKCDGSSLQRVLVTQAAMTNIVKSCLNDSTSVSNAVTRAEEDIDSQIDNTIGGLDQSTWIIIVICVCVAACIGVAIKTGLFSKLFAKKNVQKELNKNF